jgi:hypothetical protein
MLLLLLDIAAAAPSAAAVGILLLLLLPGLGALIARKESAAILHKVYFGGGSVDDATAQDVWRMLSEPPNGFQDGTVDFLGIAELQFGFDLLLNKLGGMQVWQQQQLLLLLAWQAYLARLAAECMWSLAQHVLQMLVMNTSLGRRNTCCIAQVVIQLVTVVCCFLPISPACVLPCLCFTLPGRLSMATCCLSKAGLTANCPLCATAIANRCSKSLAAMPRQSARAAFFSFWCTGVTAAWCLQRRLRLWQQQQASICAPAVTATQGSACWTWALSHKRCVKQRVA